MAATNVQAFSGDVEISSNLAVDTNTLFVDSVGNKVGIGVTNPSSGILDVAGTLRVGTDSSGLINIGRSGNVANYRFGYIYHDGTNLQILNQEGGDLKFGTDNATKMIIEETGNVSVDTSTLYVDAVGNKVGIGTDTPVLPLEIYTGNGASYGLRLRRYPTGAAYSDIGHISTPGIEGLSFKVSDGSATTQEVMRVCGNGKVGIGNNDPDASLEVFNNTLGSTTGDSTDILKFGGDSNGAGALLLTAERLSSGSNWASTGLRLQRIVDATKMAYVQFGSNTGDVSGELLFGTGDSTERMRITSSGNVGVGTASPNAMLDIYTGSTTVRGLRLNRYTSGNYVTDFYQGSYGLDIKVGHASVTPSSVVHVERFTADSARLRIASPGNIRTDGGITVPSYDDIANTKMIFDTGSRYRIFTDGDDRMLFSSAGGSGTLAATTALGLVGTSVGIGTTQPSHKLHVNGNGYASGGFFNHNQTFYVGSGVTTTIYTTLNGAQGWIWAMGNDYIYAQARYSYKAGWQGFYFASIFNSRLTTWTNNGQNIWARHDRGAGRTIVSRGIHMGGY
jgi:hypothetical protein